MTITQAMNQAETLLENIRPYADPFIFLVVRNKELRLDHRLEICEEEHTITRLSRKQINEGLNSAEWNMVSYRMKWLIGKELL